MAVSSSISKTSAFLLTKAMTISYGCLDSLVFRFLVIFLLLILVPSVDPKSVHAKCRFHAIFNFGDSNSDTGGFWAAFPPQRLPFGMTYFKRPAGRASDGRAVIDFLALGIGLPFLSPYLQSIGSDFSHGANFATAASTVLLPNTSLFVTGVSPFSLAIQLNQMKNLRDRVLEMSPKGYLPDRNIFGESIYMLDIGQNDFSGNVGRLGVKGIQKYVPQVASQIAWTIKELYDIGGRTFWVANLAPIGCFPAFLVELPHKNSDLDSYGCMPKYNKAVVSYNKLLRKTLGEVRGELPGASVVYVDTYSVKLRLFQHPRDHGFLFGTKACCGVGGGAYNFNPKVFCSSSKIINGVNISATACEDPHNYVSWDGVHATEAVNKIVAQAILNGSSFDPPFPLADLCHLHLLL